MPETADDGAKAAKAPPPKKGQAVAVEAEEEEIPLAMHSEKDLIVDGLYSDVRENLRSVNDI